MAASKHRGGARRATMRAVRRWLLPFLALLGCHREVGPPPVETLAGLSLPLLQSPALVVALEGTLNGRRAEVQLDPAQSVSFLSAACDEEPSLVARVEVPDALGPTEVFPVTRVRGLTLGGTRFRTFDAAVASGKRCVVVLGAPELADVAIEVDPASRQLRFRAPQAREQWVAEAQASGDDAQVFTLTKEPRFDWPLLPVRVRQGPARFDGAFLVSLRERKSHLFEAPARQAGLRPGLELLRGLPLPDDVALPKELEQLTGFAFDTLELAPGFGLATGLLELDKGAPPHAAQGVLGADTWGRFRFVYDVPGGLLLLRRPRLLASGSRVQCERGGALSEEACFEVQGRATDGGVDVTVTVWRPLEEGGRLSLDLPGASPGACRVGVSFGPGDRGRSSQHHFPWPKLAETLPGCEGAFVGATGVSPGLFEESPLPECSGVCAFARDAATGRLSCECQPGVRTASADAERQLLELLKKLLEKRLPPREQEPADPE
jgi:hypothetical protein